MKWAEGIDKLGIFLYLAISLFAIANIYSVDEGLGTKQFIFFGISLVVGLVIFTMRTKFFENFAGIFFILGVLSLAGLHVFGTVTNILNDDFQELIGYNTRGRNFKLGLNFMF